MTIRDDLPKAGDVVCVRSREEILATLDANGRLDGLPFMPQMFQYCGRRFEVIARAHKTCDVVAGVGRRMAESVHLDIRCDGQAYGGCQAACLLFWKTAWLKPVDAVAADPGTPDVTTTSGCTEQDVWRATHSTNHDATGETIHHCQATCVPNFTTPLAWWDVRQYIEDYTSGNISPRRLARGFFYQAYHHGTQAWRHRLGRPARWVYDLFQSAIGGTPFPRKPGSLPSGKPAPSDDLNLQTGELVRIKTHDEILATLTKGGTNRGLLFDKEMVPFCGTTVRVRARISIFVNERTGKLTTLKTPALILEGVWCQSRYSNKKMFCPRALYSWWREVWLERVPTTAASASPTVAAGTTLAIFPAIEGTIRNQRLS
jgi:hypothetical protein